MSPAYQDQLCSHSLRAGTGDSVPDDMRSWYTLVFEGMAAEHHIEKRYFRDRAGAAPTFSATVDHAVRCGLQQREHYNTYSGMALRRAALPGEEQRGRRMDCAATRVLWCELDTPLCCATN